MNNNLALIHKMLGSHHDIRMVPSINLNNTYSCRVTISNLPFYFKQKEYSAKAESYELALDEVVRKLSNV